MKSEQLTVEVKRLSELVERKLAMLERMEAKMAR